MLESILNSVITVIVAVIACSGFWEFLKHRRAKRDEEDEKKDDLTKLVLILCQDKIAFLGLRYIERGYINKDELELLLDIFDPYERKGGNGIAKKVVDECKKLPLYESVHFKEDNNANK